MAHQIQQQLHWNGLESKSVVLVARVHAAHGYISGILSCLLMLLGEKCFNFIRREMAYVYCRLIENVSPEKAVQLYQQAASVFEVSSVPLFPPQG